MSATSLHSVTAPVLRGPASRHGTLRLTRRGRLAVVAVLISLALALVLALSVALAFEADAGSTGGSPDAAQTWVVQPGETLWSIAEQLDPAADPRDTVARIVAMNDLQGSSVLVGQEIFVPA